MITQRDLVQRLARRNLGAWSVVERIQDIAITDELRALQRRDNLTRLAVIVHLDVPRGRGSARLDLDDLDGSPDDLIDQAISLAGAAIGPAWTSTPPAAPARVTIVDEQLLERELDAASRNTLAGLRRPRDVTVLASAQILREKITLIASSGFHFSWPATTIRADALVTSAPRSAAAAAADSPAFASTSSTASASAGNHRSLAIAREARRIEDLDLDGAFADAAADLLHLADAGPPPTGPCALWLGPEPLLHGGDHGLWTVFAHQADSAVERHGLSRYRRRAEIAPGAAQLTEPLSIASNGALDFATRSAPVTDDAVAIRRFSIIDRGVAVGLGLSPREAALRNTDPNGGVRNLVVSLGTWSATPSPTARTIEVRRLHALSIDPYTGDASLDIALGLEHRPGGAEPIPFTGGTVRLDLIAALALARRSSQPLRRGAYHGPASILIDASELMT
jgi:predicted Zn-dependent protease